MTYRFDTVAIRIKNESAIIIAMINRAEAGSAIVAAARFERPGMKGANRLTAWRAEADMQSHCG